MKLIVLIAENDGSGCLWGLVLAVVFGIVASVITVTLNEKKRQKIINALRQDKRMTNAKVFSQHISTPIAISEDGDIGIIDIKTETFEIIHIKNVNGFELIVDGRNIANVRGAVAGGLLFGGVGAIIGGGAHKEKITKMELLLKINDFNDPIRNIPLIATEIKKGPGYDAIQKEIQTVMATLEIVEKKIRESNVEESQ
jgi:hypothetical protein